MNNLTQEELQALFELYKEYADSQTDPYIIDSVNIVIQEIEKNPEAILSKLSINLTFDAIEEIFQKYGVIQLRKVGLEDKLLLGCGNTPADAKYNNRHEHIGFETINPELHMNPCIVGAFGKDSGLIDVLPNNYYTALYGESVTICSDESEIPENYFSCLKPKFLVYELGEAKGCSFSESNMVWNDYECDDYKEYEYYEEYEYYKALNELNELDELNELNELDELNELNPLNDYGQPINPTDDQLELIELIRKGNVKDVYDFLEAHKSINLNYVDTNYDSPLLISATLDSTDMAKILLEAGASPTMSSYGQTAIAECKALKYFQFASLMEEYVTLNGNQYNDINPTSNQLKLLALIQSGNEEAVSTFLEEHKPINLNYGDNEYNTPLTLAAMQNKITIADILLKAGALVDYAKKSACLDKYDNETGLTPLMQAAGHGNLEQYNLLLKLGADPAKESNEGKKAEDFLSNRTHAKVRKKF